MKNKILSLGFSIPQFVLIFILHLLLLGWIFYVLSHSGSMKTSLVFYHFLGISLSGALLIRVCAWIAFKRYEKK